MQVCYKYASENLSVFALEICRVVSNLHEQRGQETDSDSGRGYWSNTCSEQIERTVSQLLLAETAKELVKVANHHQTHD